jgi:hypothetical protein
MTCMPGCSGQPARHVRAHQPRCELRGLRLFSAGKADQDDAGAIGSRGCPLLAQSGHCLVHCTCPLLTQSGHAVTAVRCSLSG